MAADLHIHVIGGPNGCSEEDVASFKCNNLGSKFFDLSKKSRVGSESWDRVTDSPNIWVGEVSWLKASLLDDRTSFVPGAIERISELVGEDFPTIDEPFISKVMEAFMVPNDTGYSITDAAPVKKFLEEHIGKKCFTVSW